MKIENLDGNDFISIESNDGVVILVVEKESGLDVIHGTKFRHIDFDNGETVVGVSIQPIDKKQVEEG